MKTSALRALGVFVLAMAVCFAIGSDTSGALAAVHPGEAGNSVPVSSVYSCATGKPKTSPIGSRLILTATLGPYTASVEGVVAKGVTGIPALSHLSVTLGASGKIIESFQPFALLPSTTIGTIEEAPTTWDPAVASNSTASYPVGSICIAKLAGSLEPTVLLPVLTGYNQCCEIINLYDMYAFPGASFANAVGAVNLGPTGNAALIEENGSALFVTADSSFFSRFSDHAGSALPIRVLGMNVNTGFVDVTRSWPSLVTADAKYWMRLSLDDKHGDNRGVLAAWTADECNLGHCASAFNYLEQQRKAGDLTGDPPTAAAFISGLRSYLRTAGY